jgi:hypothetical protein
MAEIESLGLHRASGTPYLHTRVLCPAIVMGIAMVLGVPAVSANEFVLPADYQMFEIDVHEAETPPRFEFYRVENGSLSTRAPVSVYTVDVYLRGGSPTLWQIQCSKDAAHQTVTYGVVPAGCEQTVPASGAADGLENGREYSLGATGTGAGVGWVRFIYKGP